MIFVKNPALDDLMAKFQAMPAWPCRLSFVIAYASITTLHARPTLPLKSEPVRIEHKKVLPPIRPTSRDLKIAALIIHSHH